MHDRLELQKKLENLLGSNHVYFQPPSNIRMHYPAIVYKLNNIDNTFADNSVYNQTFSYQVTIIDENPDSEIVKKLSRFPLTRFSNHYTSDNLNHDVFIINF